MHLFRAGHGWAKLWGLIAGIVAVVALATNLSNSLGAIAGRADQTIAKRTDAKDSRQDLRATLDRLTREREALTFTPATADDVGAAKAAVVAAARIREAECGSGRGPRCRAREAAEQVKREALAKVLGNKALSDRAAKIDADIAATRARLDTAPAVAAVDPRAELLARIFSVGADTAATGQQVATVVVVELLIAFALIAWELLAVPAVGLQECATGGLQEVSRGYRTVSATQAPLPPARAETKPGPVKGRGKTARTKTRTRRTVDQRKVRRRGPGGPVSGEPGGPTILGLRLPFRQLGDVAARVGESAALGRRQGVEIVRDQAFHQGGDVACQRHGRVSSSAHGMMTPYRIGKYRYRQR